MPAPSWPPTLQQAFLRGTMAEEWGENRIFSAMESGPAKVRRRTTAAVGHITGELFLTFDELAILEEFYENVLSHGTIVFAWVYTPLNGLTTFNWLLRFRTPPSYRRVADHAVVSLDLDRIP
jgi:hypothetical protein